MEEVITYKASDGTSFENKAECIRYEENLNESLKLRKKIKSYIKQNYSILLEFLALVKCYCTTFSCVGDCKGCLFAKDDQYCVISDMPEEFDIEELEKIFKECSK